MSELHEYRRLIIRIRKTLTTMTHSQRRDLRRHHVRPFDLPSLADVKVLAIRTQPVTTGCGYREYLRTGHVMCDWFLLYRIDMSGNHFPIDQEMELAANILPDPTQPNLSLGNVTIASARCASDPRVSKRLVQLRLSYHITLLYWAEHNFSHTTAYAILGLSASNPFPYLLAGNLS